MRPQLLAAVLAALVSGCAWLGYQPTTVPVSRDALTFRAGRASMLHDLIAPVVRDGCAAGQATPEVCRAAGAAEAEYQALVTLYRQAMAAGDTPDPARLLAAAEQLVQVAAPLLLKMGLRLPGLL